MTKLYNILSLLVIVAGLALEAVPDLAQLFPGQEWVGVLAIILGAVVQVAVRLKKGVSAVERDASIKVLLIGSLLVVPACTYALHQRDAATINGVSRELERRKHEEKMLLEAARRPLGPTETAKVLNDLWLINRTAQSALSAQEIYERAKAGADELAKPVGTSSVNP